MQSTTSSPLAVEYVSPARISSAHSRVEKQTSPLNMKLPFRLSEEAFLTLIDSNVALSDSTMPPSETETSPLMTLPDLQMSFPYSISASTETCTSSSIVTVSPSYMEQPTIASQPSIESGAIFSAVRTLKSPANVSVIS